MMCEMAKNTTPQKEAGKESGDSLPQKEESQAKKEEVTEEKRERYVVQVSQGVEGEDNWLSLKKEGKIFIFSSKRNAEESLNRVMSKHPEMIRGRVMRIEKRGDSNTLIPEIEISGKQVVEHNKEILPKEMQGYISEDMLSFMNEEEIQGIRSLIADLIRKKEEVAKFGRIAVQRSAFKKDTKRVKRMEELQKKYHKRKEALQKAKEAFERIKESVHEFIEENLKEYPELERWLRVSITGEGRLPSPNRGQGRRRVPEGKKGIILKFLQMHRGEKFREVEIIKGIKEAEMGEDYSWSQQSVNPRIRSMLSEGIISQDEQGRYYLP
ncbi:MAG: hypothetical protein QIT36_gp065 [Methanophagales virus GBV301]|uniref:Uncharacterized protein n=1 Tax=Methanophagales virus GBV301 TaxID=2999280 RepID=A0A9E9A5Y9_9CAUD|nr:MAG: hypothetical protein QIT36_gp065 [Methanophagales virus GBV301]WAE39489.1 MAG: hypothetical protein LDLAKGPJ_00065 [Methanophagales virus GBV301]